MNVLRSATDAVRGALIGAAEVIPGVSGGTVALITGVYATLIESASDLVRGVILLTDVFRGRGLSRSAARFAAVRWRVVIPVLVGMAVAVVLGAKLLAPLIEQYPVQTRAVFTGIIAASLIVPIRMVGRAWSWRLVLLAVSAAVAAFLLTGLPAARASEPPLIVVALAAAVAICALVLPGVSGSFLLLAFGMYETTLAAVNERNLSYLAVFALGAIVGLGLFVNVLRLLLTRYPAITLAVMAGLMLGSLRALWPWQDEQGGLQAPRGDVVASVLLALAGAAVVLVLLAVERQLARRPTSTDPAGLRAAR